MNSKRKIDYIPEEQINAGMPYLTGNLEISRLEFLPSWFYYIPVIFQSLWLGAKYRDLRLPLIANPGIKLSGMVGESKADIFKLAGDIIKPWILPNVTLEKSDETLVLQKEKIIEAMQTAGVNYPLVAKPDQGCRGVGIKLVHSEEQLMEYINKFPVGYRYMLQEKAPYQAEAGVFYVRSPNEKKGEIISMTLKYRPYVVGDGHSTLRQLIEQDERAGELTHIYFPKYLDKLDTILDKDESFALTFAGNHSRGSIFRNGNEYISEGLTKRLDELLSDVEGFYYGRLDIKFKNIESFMEGDDFCIIEINGASSEATHIWDNGTTLKEIFSTLLKQYRILYDIGHQQKKKGIQPPSVSTLLKEWKKERALVRRYPQED